MSKLAAVAVAVGLFAAIPAFISSAQANETSPAIKLAAADVSIRVNDGSRHRHHHHRHWRGAYACTTKAIWRHGRRTVIKRCG